MQNDSSGSPAANRAIQHQTRLPVVGIGASAGGLEALREAFAALPADTGAAYVVVQHLDPTHSSLMAELLARYTQMSVVQVRDGMAVTPDVVHVIPPNTSLTISNGVLQLAEPVSRRGTRMPIDLFLTSLAADQQEAAIAVILSGTGADGTYGVREVKAHGGIAIAQEPRSAQFDGMPLNAIATGVIDHVLRPEAIAGFVATYSAYLRDPQRSSPVPRSEDQDLESILSLLLARQGYDFTTYKRGTLERRIRRRMALNQIEGLTGYLEVLRTDREEEKALTRDLLIGVTSFFRDPEAWDALAQDILPKLLQANHPDNAFRVWVPGCATGEEAYTLAMLIVETVERLGLSTTPVIFATDIALTALETARQGRYPESIAADLSADRLERFFAREGDQYIVKPELRDLVIFAPQNLITDPPFSRIDLISCRNLLIYIDSPYQDRVMALFHFALADGGYLMLGGSETIGGNQTLFQPVSRKWRLYQRIDSSRPRQLPNLHDHRPLLRQSDLSQPVQRQVNYAQLAQHQLMHLFAPAAVLIDEDQLVRYYYGRVSDYLGPSTGEPTTHLLSLVGDVMRAKLRGLIQQVVQQQYAATAGGVQVQRGDEWHSTRINVYPVHNASAPKGLLLITFNDEEQTQASPAVESDLPGTENTPLLNQLKEELTHTRQELYSTIEQMETANEELKASNEEVLSMNEELQSSNEELETSKEELQSLNEELITLNNQLEEKVRELEDSNDDLHNLFTSTEIATLFVDRDLRIRRYTPATTALLKVIESDVGRHLTDVVWRFIDDHLLDAAAKVLAGERVEEHLIQAENGRWYSRRLFPYQTGAGITKGVVITFVDITERREHEHRLRERERYLQRITDAMPGLISYIDTEERYRFNNAIYKEWFGIDPSGLAGKSIRELKGEDIYRFIKPKIDEALSGRPVEFDFILPETRLGCRYVHGSYIPDIDPDSGEVKGFFSLLTDVTERTEHEQQIESLNNILHQSVEEQKTLFAAAPVGIFVARDPQCAEMQVNAAGARLLSIPENGNPSTSHPDADQLPFRVFRNGQPLDGNDLPMQRAAREGRTITDEQLELRFRDGRQRIVTVHAAPLYNDGQVRGCIGAVVDTTDYNNAIEELAESDRRKDRFVAMLAHELRNPLTALVIAADLVERHEDQPTVIEHVREALINQTRHLSRLVDDLLDVARITQDRLQLKRESFDLRTSLRDAIHTVEPEVQARHQTLSHTLPEAPLRIFGDPTRLTQVFSNLLKNAAIYTPDQGRITLSVTRNADQAKVAIQDTGSGLSAEDLENIFEPLERSPRASSISQGLGLGLPLAKRITELHGGRIEVFSDGVDKGSRFSVVLPLADAAQDASAPARGHTRVQSEALRILIVDDEPSVAETLALLLKLQGHTIETIDHPDKVAAAVDGFAPEVILLDIGLPVRSGFEVAAELKARPNRAEMRVIALSGHVDKIGGNGGDPDDELFDGRLLKPVTEAQLLKALES